MPPQRLGDAIFDSLLREYEDSLLGEIAGGAGKNLMPQLGFIFGSLTCVMVEATLVVP